VLYAYLSPSRVDSALSLFLGGRGSILVGHPIRGLLWFVYVGNARSLVIAMSSMLSDYVTKEQMKEAISKAIDENDEKTDQNSSEYLRNKG